MNLPLFGSLGQSALGKKLGLPQGVTHPTWVVLEIGGAYPERQPTQPLQALLNRTETVEALAARAKVLAGADWLHGVVVRFSEFAATPATAHAIREILTRLGQSKRVLAFVPQVGMTTLIAASGAHEIVAPESAEVTLHGFGLESTYLGEFLRKSGVEFENLRIREYKAALTRFSEDHMDAANREQLEAYLAGLERAWVSDVAAARGVAPEQARAWLDAGLTSAAGLLAAGVIDRVAYEDELVGPATRPLEAVLDLLTAPFDRPKPGEGRIAVIPVIGTIVTGKSRRNPLPLPLVGGVMAGSDTVVGALRRAQEDKTTRAVVVYVNSGGGSALASDLMWRAIERSEKPVVVVMGEYAASGGYYLAAAARRIIASPYTLTGSIGVVSGKPVLQKFNERHGLNPEAVGRRRALMYSASRPFDGGERAEIERSISEVYDRFVARVAQGRGLSREQVNEIGRGRIWSGQDALDLGLVDELGDLHLGLQRAAELAGLPADAPVWNAAPKKAGPLPEFVHEVRDAARLNTALWPFGQERALTWLDQNLRVY